MYFKERLEAGVGEGPSPHPPGAQQGQDPTFRTPFPCHPCSLPRHVQATMSFPPLLLLPEGGVGWLLCIGGVVLKLPVLASDSPKVMV